MNHFAKRIIPCLDVKDGRVVKGVNFVGLIDAGDPVEIAKRYNEEGADELCFLDITASHLERDTIVDVVERVARGLFIPLIVVNCIVLGRAEAVAAKSSVLHSTFDGLGIGLGFTCSLTLLGLVRELLGAGTVFGQNVYPKEYGALLFVLAPGAFIVLGYLIALSNKIAKKK